MINKIKINNQLWLYFSHNKWVLGNKSFSSDIHFTLHFGGSSGKLDLHFKNEKTNKYFTVLTILKDEIDDIIKIIIRNMIPVFREKLKILNLRDFKRKYHIIDYKILEKKIQNHHIEDFLNYLNIKEKKKILDISTSIENFKMPYNYKRLIKSHIIQNRRRLNIYELSGGSAINKSGGNFSYIVLEKNICLFDSNIVENFDKVMIQAIGTDLFNQVIDRFQLGIEYLNSNKKLENNYAPIDIRIIRNV